MKKREICKNENFKKSNFSKKRKNSYKARKMLKPLFLKGKAPK